MGVDRGLVVRISADLAGLRKELANADASIKPVVTSISKLASEFKGDKVVGEVNRMVIAIERVGGASGLSAIQQERVNKKVLEAISIYNRLGKEVPPEWRKIEAATRSVEERTHGVHGALRGLGPLIATTFSVAALKSFATSLFDSADSLAKMSDKTGLSAAALQRLEAAANGGGNTIEEVAAAVNKLQVNLAGEDKGAVKALKALNLNLSDLRAMQPEQQFTTVADAIKQVHDPADQAKLRVLLFGKAGNEIAGTLNQDFAKIAKDVRGMKDRTIDAFDGLGDKIGQIGTNIKNEIANWLVATYDWIVRAADAVAVAYLGMKATVFGVFADLAEASAKMNIVPGVGDKLKAYAAEWRHSAQVAEDAVKIHVKMLLDEAKASQASAVQTKVTTTAHLDLGDTAARQAPKVDELTKALAGMASQERLATLNVTQEFIAKLGTSFDVLSERPPLASRAIAGFVTELAPAVQQVQVLNRETYSLAKTLGGYLLESLYAIPGALQAAFTGGGGMSGAFKSIFSGLGGNIGTTVFGDLAAKGSQLFANTFGVKATEFLGQVLPGVGGALGALASKFIAPVFDKLFKTEGRKVNDLRDEFIAAAGGLHELNVRASEAGLTLNTLLRADTVKEYEAAVAQLTGAFAAQNAKLEEQKRIQEEIKTLEGQIGDKQKELAALEASLITPWDELQGIVQKYDGDVAALGETFRQMKTSADTTSILNDFEKLTRAGADAGATVNLLSPAIRGVVNDSLKMGTAVPANMKPLIEEMIRAGSLTDEAGVKITDIGKIKFGEPVKTEGDKVKEAMALIKTAIEEMTTKLGEFVDKLKRVPENTEPERREFYRRWEREPWRDWEMPEVPGRTEEAGGGGSGRPGGTTGGRRPEFAGAFFSALRPAGGTVVLNVTVQGDVSVDRRKIGELVFPQVARLARLHGLSG